MSPNQECPNCHAVIADSMTRLTPEENRFLDVFLREATTEPFTGAATKALHRIGIEYGDISYIAWAYEQAEPGSAPDTPRE